MSSLLSQLQTATTWAATSALSVTGIRVGIHEPEYSAEPLIDGVQIRRYGPRIAAETTATAGEAGGRAGLRRLAGYLDGANQQHRRIALAAPVAIQIDRRVGPGIAVTVPASPNSAGQEQSWTIRLFIPAASSIDNLPAPDDPRVRLIALPAESVAVLRFTGTPTADAVAARTTDVLAVLRETGFYVVGPPSTWLYDARWTLPCLRRNEVAVPIDD